MTTKERCAFLCIIVVVLVTVFSSVEAGDWGYYYDDYYYEPIETYHVYPTVPGTMGLRDYDQPGWRIEVDRFGNERGYQTVPGTRDLRDYDRPGYRIDRR